MREICLPLPDVSESEHFGEACFRVGRRIFATCGVKDGVCRVVVQLESHHARRLLAEDPRFQPYSRQKDGIWTDASDIEDWDEVSALVLESYRLNGPDRPPTRAGSKIRKKTGKGS
jgi:hypothetical protein